MRRAISARVVWPAITLTLVAGFVAGIEWERVAPRLRYRREKIVFTGPHSFTLEGAVYYPRSLFRRHYPGILLCHGLLGKGKDAKLYRLLARELASMGYLAMSFDLRGFGNSASVAHFRVPRDLDFVADLKAALSHMAEKLPVDRENITIAGHSMGGNLAFAVGAGDDRVKNIVAISSGNYGPPDRYSARRKEIFIKKFGSVLGEKLSEKRWERLEKPLNMFQYLPLEKSKRVCIVLADGDWPGTVNYNRRLFDKLGVEKKLIVISDSNHTFGTEYYTGDLLIDPRPVRVLASKIDAWLRGR